MNWTDDQERMMGEIVKAYGFADIDAVKKHMATTQTIMQMLFSGIIKNKLELFQIIENEFPQNQWVMAAYSMGSTQAHFAPNMWGAKKPTE